MEIETIDTGGNALMLSIGLMLVTLSVLGVAFFWKFIVFGDMEIKKNLWVEGNVGIGAEALPEKNSLLFLSGRSNGNAEMILRSNTGSGSNQQNIRFQTHSIARGGGLYWEDITDPNFRTFFGRSYNGGNAISGLSYKVNTSTGNVDTHTAGNTHLFIRDSDGNVGMGVTIPNSAVHVLRRNPNLLADNSYFQVFLTPNSVSGTEVAKTRMGWYSDTFDIACYRGGGPNFSRFGLVHGGLERITILDNGNVGIGVTLPEVRLAVTGALRTTLNGQNHEIVGTDHVYSAYFPRGMAQGRKGYVGFGGAGTTNFTMLNEDTGTLRLGTNNFLVAALLPDRTMTVGHDNGVSGGIFLTSTARYGKPAVQSITDTFGTDDLLLNPVNGNVGIATSSPQNKIHVVSNGDIMRLDQYTTSEVAGAAILTRFARGTSEAPLQVLNNDVVFGIFSRAHSGTGHSANNVGAIRILADGNQTTSSSGTKIDFATTVPGAISRDTRMTIMGSGNVGIGTAAPVARLDVRAGDIRVGANPGGEGDGWAAGTVRFGVEFFNNDLGPGVGQAPNVVHTSGVTAGIKPYVVNSTGYSGLGIWNNTAPNTPVNFGSAPVMLFRDSNVGIGTVNPSIARLHIQGGVSRSTVLPVPNQWFTGNTSGYQGSSGFTITTNNNPLAPPFNVSLYADQAIWGGAFIASSDRRIKTDVRRVENDEALNTIRKLKPSTYNYVDTAQRGEGRVFGFIAQEVGEVLPHAVSTSGEFIPDVYSLANLNSSGFVVLDREHRAHGLMVGDRIRVYWEGISLPEDHFVEEVIDTDTFRIDVINKPSRVFVFGRFVEDFHTLDKNAIFTVGVAAIQDLDRRVQSLTERLEIIETLLRK